ncbi:MAG TPA: copper transporter [Streptosporangiaceae bacterium]
MIDFRYHLVSIVAVFLALAIGIVLGSTELQGPVYNALHGANSSLRNQLSNANNQRQAAQQEADAGDAFAQAIETDYLHGKLAGQRLLIITEPGAQAAVVNGVGTAARDAGATVTGQVNLQTRFFDGSSATAVALSQINTDLAQSDGIQLDSSSSSSPQQGAAKVLASEILTKASTAGGIQQAGTTQATSAQTALGSYAQANFLTTNGEPATQATLAVIVTPQTVPADRSVDPLAQDLGPFAQALASVYTSPTVVVGSVAGSVPGSPIAELRSTGIASQVSTVDDADSVRGQMVVIQALEIALNGGTAGSYGINAGNSYPNVTPSASVSPSASSSSTPTKKPKK